MKKIAIFGSSKVKPEDAVYKTAFEAGLLCAKAGFTVVNGGYGGVMAASAKGARQAGGKIIGVSCTAFGRGSVNEYITEEIKTDCLQKRLQILLELADGYIVLPGSTGTLLELAEIWELTNKGFVKPAKPIILIGKFFAPLVKMMAAQDTRTANCLEFVQNAQEAMRILNE